MFLLPCNPYALFIAFCLYAVDEGLIEQVILYFTIIQNFLIDFVISETKDFLLIPDNSCYLDFFFKSLHKTQKNQKL